MIVKKQFVKNPKVIFQGVNGRKYITIHETGNTKQGAGAKAHANLQKNGFSSSWHWQVDDQIAIQSYPHTAQCWHAGDGRGTGNLQSIAIEICVNEDSDYRKAVNHAITLTKRIMKEEGISAERVVQHHHWSGKNCPSRLRGGKSGVNWSAFKQQLQTAEVMDTLRFGSTGTAVKDLQKKLSELGYNLVLDGSFGPATEKVIKFFQSMHGLKVDGIFGHETEARLNRLIKAQSGQSVNVLQYGAIGKAVSQLQISLNEVGYRLAVDHSFGAKTKEAVQQFQKNHQLEIDGSVGPKTWAALKREIFK